MIDEAFALIDRAVASGLPPAAQACAIHRGAVVHDAAHAIAPDALFDLASVTKMVATTSALAALAVDLDSNVATYIAEFRHPDVTVRELLGHRSGMPGWRPFFAEVVSAPVAGRVSPPHRDFAHFDRARAIVVDGVLQSGLEVRGRRVYSDLGFIALGELVGVVADRLDRFCAERVLAPLGLKN